MESTYIYSELNLYETGDKFYIQPISEAKRTLIIDRVTNAIEIKADGETPSYTETKTIYGVLGIIRLIAGQYIIVATGREKVGTLSGQDIFKLTSYEVISFSRKMTHLNEKQESIEREYISMIDNVLSTPHFYFSYVYDISHSVQRLQYTSPDFLTSPMYLRGEQKFIWNEYLLAEFPKIPGIGNFCLPLIHGFVSITSCSLNGKNFSLAIISRRSKDRAGCRLFTRGVDANGNVANFVETEQIVERAFERASFVQVSQKIFS